MNTLTGTLFFKLLGQKPMTQHVKKLIAGGLGLLFLILGLVGILLPVLPTTPFLLLASFFFMRSSDRMHKWLLNHKLFGPTIRSYMNHRALKKSTKVKALSTLWLSLSISIYIDEIIYIDILLIVVGLCVSWYLLSLKTLAEEA